LKSPMLALQRLPVPGNRLRKSEEVDRFSARTPGWCD
jgi:hypothetical protein